MSGARILVQGATLNPPLPGSDRSPFVIEVRTSTSGGPPGGLIGTCSGTTACVATISTATLVKGTVLHCVMTSAAGPSAFTCGPVSNDTPLDYTIHVMRKNGTESWVSAKIGAPQPIDAAGQGLSDATVVLTGGPVPLPPAPSASPSEASSISARLVVSTLGGAVIPYGVEVYYQTNKLFYFGFDGRAAGAPSQFDAAITASADQVSLNATPTNPSALLTLLGGVVDGTLKTRAWPTSSIDAAVEISPVPPTIGVTIAPSGRARVEMPGAPHVRAVIDQFESSSPQRGRRQQIVADLPAMPTSIEVGWNTGPVNGKKATRFTLNPAPGIARLDLTHRLQDVARDSARAESTTLVSDMVATVLGIPAGLTTVSLIGGGPSSTILVEAPSAIGTVEFAFGIRTPAVFWLPPTVGNDYVFSTSVGASAAQLAVRLSGLIKASIDNHPSPAPTAKPDDMELIFDLTHAPTPLDLSITKASRSIFGSMTPPTILGISIDSGSSTIKTLAASSGDINDVTVNLRSSSQPFFGRVHQIDVGVSNVPPATTFSTASGGGGFALSLAAPTPFNLVTVRMREGDVGDEIDPAVGDGVLLHDTAEPYAAAVRLSRLTSADVRMTPVGDASVLDLDIVRTAAVLSLDIRQGPVSFYGSLGLPNEIHASVATNGSSVAVRPTSTAAITDVALHARSSGSPFFGQVHELDLALSNVEPDTTLTINATGSALSFSFLAAAPIRSLDAQLRQTSTADALLPAGSDGIILHRNESNPSAMPFTAQVHLSGLKSAVVEKKPSTAAGAKPDDIALSLSIEHDPAILLLDVVDGAKRVAGSLTPPRVLGFTLDTANVAVAVSGASSGAVRDISVRVRSTGAAFFGRVRQVDAEVSNIPAGATFSVYSTNDALQIGYNGGAIPIDSLDLRLRETGSGDTLPSGTDGVLLHDVGLFSAQIRLGNLLGMTALKQDCGSSTLKCSHITAQVDRTTQRDTTIDIQSLPDDMLCKQVGTPPVESCTRQPGVDSTVFRVASAPKTLKVGMKSESQRVSISNGGLTFKGTVLLGMVFAYGATEPSGNVSLRQQGPSSKTELTVDSLPSGAFNEGNPTGNAVYFCLYKSAGCTAPINIGAAVTDPSLQLFTSAPVRVGRLFSCSDATACNSNQGIHGSNLRAQRLQFAYAVQPGTVTDDRYIAIDTGGSGGSRVSGDFTVDDPSISVHPVNFWAAGAQIHLNGFIPAAPSRGKLSCYALSLSVKSIPIPGAAIDAVTGLCG